MKVEEWSFTAQSVGRLAVTLHLLLREHRLALPDDRELLDELGNVRLRESSPGVFRLDHDSGQHDDRAVALGLAALALTETPDYAGVSRITNPNVAAALAAAADPGSPAARPVVRTNTDAAPRASDLTAAPATTADDARLVPSVDSATAAARRRSGNAPETLTAHKLAHKRRGAR